MRRIAHLALVSLVMLTLLVPTVRSQTQGSETDVLRFTVIRTPDAQLLGMLVGVVDVLPSLSVPLDVHSALLAETNGGIIRTSDLEALAMNGFTITEDPGFHIGYIAWNIRDTATIQASWRPAITYWPLHDVEFRHALIHCFNQSGIISSLYGYIATPVRSLVPPAQYKYHHSAVPEHPYNPGDPLTSPPGEHSSAGILKQAGYTFVDAGTIGVVDDADYWEMPNSDPLPEMVIWTPLATDAPTSYELGVEFVTDLASIGLASTIANGNKGLINQGRVFDEYLEDVFGTPTTPGGQFDAYMAFHGLSRLPSQLFSLLHSSQDSLSNGGRSNGAGVNNGTIDILCEKVKYSLNADDVEDGAKELQTMLYTPDKAIYPDADDFALAYMGTYSRSYFNAYAPNLEGIVKSRGFGSDNKWTFLNVQWAPGTERIEDGKTVAIWTLGNRPDRLNPLVADTKYEWEIIARVYDGLTNVDPYSHRDVPWICTDWAITETAGGMEINFTLRDDVYWQDGYPLTAADVEFGLEFIRDYQVPRYAETWETLTDVIVTNATHCTVVADRPSLDLFYDFTHLATMLPPQIWDRAWIDTQHVLDYAPADWAYGADMAPGYSAGPWASEVPTNLFGTGPWVYQFFDEASEYSDLWANQHYFLSPAEIDDLIIEMFWEAGDVDRDGSIQVTWDVVFMVMAYGFAQGEPGYDPNCDLNTDGVVDICDTIPQVKHFLEQRTYGPNGGGGGESGGDQSSSFQSESGASRSSVTPTMRVDPAEIVDYALTTNDTVLVDINITNVRDLMGYDFRLTFNETILHVESVILGDFLGEDPAGWHSNINNAAGFVRFASTCTLGTQMGESGSGTLATINFTVQGYGNSSLAIQGFTKLANSQGISVNHDTFDGYFDNRHPGDVNADKIINVLDMTIVSFAYGRFQGEPGYDPVADINNDGFVDMKDMVIVARHLLWTWED